MGDRRRARLRRLAAGAIPARRKGLTRRMPENTDDLASPPPSALSDGRRRLVYRLNMMRLHWSLGSRRSRKGAAPAARTFQPGELRKAIDDTIASLSLWQPPIPLDDQFSSNLLRDELHRLLSAIDAFARANGLRVAVYLTPQKFRIMPFAGEQRAIRRATRNARLHFALIGGRDRLCLVHELIPWKPDGDGFVATPDDVPHKRIRRPVGAPPALPAATDMTPDFPIDAVYTWVNAEDPEWQRLYAEHAEGRAIDFDRFGQRDELRYSLRSLDLYAPWLRRIFVFSNCRPPSWFRASDRFRWVMHDEVIDKRFLPTFNSHAIETFLHRIPGLADRFIYLNDDFFLFDWSRPSDFFDATGRSISRLEPYGAVLHHELLASEGLARLWQVASVTGAKMLWERFGRYPLRLHSHAPFALSRPVYENIEAEFPTQIETTRSNRFRSAADVSFTSFFYHQYALARGLAVPGAAAEFLADNSSYHRLVRELRRQRQFQFVCINDGRYSSTDRAFADFKDRILPLCFPLKSSGEE
jgi:hypothetical protein